MNIQDVILFAEKINDVSFIEQLQEVSEFNINASFGTAGIRGIIGAGKGDINSVVIAYATHAYASFILKKKTDAKKGVVIANDNRRNGKVYRELVSRILNSRGIKTYMLEDDAYMATPLLSYFIRKLGAAGGINITASHNPKEYNGFKVYDGFGGQLMPQDTKVIAEEMGKVSLKDINIEEYNPTLLKKGDINKYVGEVTSIVYNTPSNIKVAYSPLNGTGIDVAPKLFDEMKVEYSMVEKEFTRDSEFKHVKSPNPEDSASYKNVVKIARKNKSDIALLTDPDSDRMGIVVKYKKRWKYLTGNEFASIYAEYMLSQLSKRGAIPKDAYIVKSYVSTDLVSKIAEKYGVEVREVPVGFKNIANMIENGKGKFLFGFEESYGLLINPNIARDKDAFQGIVAAIEMTSFYKKQNLTLFDVLKNIQNEFGIHRNIQTSQKVDDESVNRMLKRIKASKEIAGHKISEIIDYRKDKENPHMSIKAITNDGSWVVVRPSGTEPKVKVYTQTTAKIGQDLMQAVVKEKRFDEYIDSVTEYFPDKKFSWKTVIKYTIFTLIMAGLLYFVFDIIYGNYKTGSGSALTSARDFKHSYALWIIFIGIAGMFFNIFVDAWMKFRLLRFHGQNVKMRHIVISAIMGSIISYLTPLAIGGDGIGYWYLRRKGFKRAPLAATFLTSTVLWQMKNIVLTAILLPMGLHMFKDILTNGDAASKSVMIIFVVGLVWDMFSIFMLWILLMSKTFQNWCITTAIKLLEWMPFVVLTDPGAKAAGFMYEFANLREGMQKIWKSPKMLGESMFYEVLPKLFSIGALLNIAAGFIKPDLEYGQYWSQIVATDVVNTANSFSLTPGSTGFVEFISLHIRDSIYEPASKFTTGNSQDTVINLDVIGKFTTQWPYLGLSALLAIIIVLGESRNKMHAKRSKFNEDKKTTSLYRKTVWIWPLFIGGWISIIILF